MPLSRAARWAMIARSFAVQGSWNYRTLLGPGFAFALLPALRAKHGAAEDELTAAVRRHANVFNCNPYLAPMALGAVAALEAANEDPQLIERFKAGVRGSLGTMGDRLVWAGWRPVCLLISLALLMLGVSWWLAVVVFVVLYNAGHVWLRLWSFRLGLAEGKLLGQRLRGSRMADAQRVLSILGAFLLGLVLPLAATGRLIHYTPSAPWIALAVLAAAAGTVWGSRVRAPASLALAAVALLGILLRFFE
jgi:mannose/fructose/N-acetylgalactosamine-specific phosphotransferase system component IID